MISQEQFSKIKLVISDVDGVLTDGTVGYGADDFIKFFHYRDGHWIKLAMRTGILFGLVSGRCSAANRKRAEELGLTFCMEDVHDKLAAFEEILEKYQVKPEECMYIGDDAIDMPVMKRVGIAVAVADGIPELDEFAHYRTTALGGHGAICEIMRKLIIGQGNLDKVMERYRR